MKLTFDPEKNIKNQQERGISFELACEFDWAGALFAIDDRYDYGETRVIAIGSIHGRLHVMVYTERDEELRIISLRKANARERKLYEKSQKRSDG
jgi:uncharacterized DUF497 family protein